MELAAVEGGSIDARKRKVRSVSFPHGEWQIVLDTVSDGESERTRMRVRFRVGNPLRLSIRRHNVFTRLATRLGLDDVVVPDPAIDRAFLVRADNSSVACSLVLDRPFASALLALRRGQLRIDPVRKGLRRVPDAGELRWVAAGSIKDADVLAGALRLMRAAITGLTRLGVMREPL